MNAARASIETSVERETRRLAHARTGVRADPVLHWGAMIGVLWLVAYAVATLATGPNSASRQFLSDVVYLLPIVAATALCVPVLRRHSGRRRRLWQVLLVSNVLWLAGEVTWTVYAYADAGDAPFPSIADLFYLSSYALVPVAILAAFSGATRLRRTRAVLDGFVVALGVGALGWEVLIAPQVGFGWSLATATGIAYPLLGLIIVITLISVGLSGHRQVAASTWLVGAAFSISALTDAGYTYLSSLHDYLDGAWLNLGWQAEAVLLCLAALCAARHDEGDSQVDRLGRDLAMVPVLLGVAAAIALIGQQAVYHGMEPFAVIVAGIVVVMVVVRFAISVSDHRHTALRLDDALREQERLAVTDGLTGLYNRRFFEEVLRLEVERAVRGRGSVALIVVDLDHFKQVNDSFGHQSGDAVLVRASLRLREALRDSDVLARYGGEEFVVILPGADGEVALELAERCRQALARQPITLAGGSHVSISGSFGVAALPEDAEDVDGLILAADRAVYAAKDAGRDQVVAADARRNPADRALPAQLGALARLADVVDGRLSPDEHSAAMTRWAGVLADALGLDAVRRSRAQIAARLHDIGKIVISEHLLQKPEPLSESEWAIIRSHPDEGARLLLEIPGQREVAEIVRGHHERFDGTGYPNGIAGDDLPVETRIVSVVDTWATMLARRAYAPVRTIAEARAELRRAAGTQLDPQVVEAFLELQASGAIDDLHPCDDDIAALWPAADAGSSERSYAPGQPSSVPNAVENERSRTS